MAGSVYWRQGGRLLLRAALETGIPLSRGVLYCQPGPTYETQAEGRMARRMGADLAAMSLAPEALLARRMGCRVVGLSLVTNMVFRNQRPAKPGAEWEGSFGSAEDPRGAGTGRERLDHDEVLAAAARYRPALRRLLRQAIPLLAEAISQE